MFILKINATPSTNTFLKQYIVENDFEQECAVITENQTAGRGQVGNIWHSQEGKSLTFSIFKKINLLLQHSFYLNMAVSLAVKNCLDAYRVPQVKVKWPNDILSADKKICGILIENFSKGSKIYASVIGIGLNVNEEKLPDLPHATSMFLATQKNYDKEVVAQKIISSLEMFFENFLSNTLEDLYRNYKDSLYKIHTPITFENTKNERFTGIIRDVTTAGKLVVENDSRHFLEYDIKEIKMVL